MEIAGFRFNVGEIDGYRLIESVFPETIDSSQLVAVVTNYYSFWEEERPTVTLGDVSTLADFDDQARQILLWVAQRSLLRPELVAAAWTTGGNERSGAAIRAILTAANRECERVFESREESLEYLRGCIREHASARSEARPIGLEGVGSVDGV